MKLRRKLSSYGSVPNWMIENESSILRYYIKKDLTAKKFAEMMNVEYSSAWKNKLQELYPKGKGLGGSRIGSGNKKGIKFCGKCRKQKNNCICDPK